MKHVFVGDLHGRTCWQDIDPKKYEKIVFVGDYVDSFTLEDDVIFRNLKNIIKFKKDNWHKVELLLGNHDVQYLHFPRYQIKGFRPSMQQGLTDTFYRHKDYFKMAYQRGKYICTHAGITNAWFNEFLKSPILKEIKDDKDTIADLFNKVEVTAEPQQRYMLYSEGFYRGLQGDLGNGSLMWADIKETSVDMLTGYHQIVGHNAVPEPTTISYTNNSITYIDVLATMTYFHEADI